MSTPCLLNTVNKACHQVSSSLPSNFRALLAIRRISAGSTSHLLDLSGGGSTSHTAYFGLTQLFDGQLDDIKTGYLTCWTPALEVELQGAELYLCATNFALSAAGKPNNATALSLHQETALLKGLKTAITLIKSTTTLSLTPADNDIYPAGPATFYPKQYFTTLFFAATFLFRLLLSSLTATQQDRDLAVTGLMDAHKIFQTLPKIAIMFALLSILRRLSRSSASKRPPVEGSPSRLVWL